MAVKKQWSKHRPVRPDVDPIYLEIRKALLRDPRSCWAKANESGLSPTTIKRWEEGLVHAPQGLSLRMAAKLLGKKLVLI